ncbi:MAG TPA: helix-turn-helix domain-containing protein [Baekduia sp.]|uniref:PucR family transcriptional regulator n=1 Tax=Baekduia sp. TaxID=2600305 RepID=UPI002D766573|nr:helix-turn-helix domain-containing protein [Baekduia sp.]HET6508956.1 helix-turn-helix domain-containing protein [Baekduia sp.]
MASDVRSTPRPWHALPDDLGALVSAAIPGIADELVEVLGPAIPVYRTLDGPFGRDVVQAVADALHDFAAVIQHRPPTPDRALYVAVGERWLRSGHSLDDLQSGYHVGARVVWRRIAAVATGADATAATVAVLADALFAYLDEIAALTVEGFVAAQAAAAGEVERRRARLLALLVATPAPDRTVLERAALEAGWPLPRRVAAIALGDPEELRAHRLPADVLAGTADGCACLVVADPDGPGRTRELAAALRGVTAAMGPPVAVEHAARSWARARALRRLVAGGGQAADGLHHADDHLLELLLAEDPSLVDDLAGLRLAPLAALTPSARSRLEQTLLAYLRHRGNGPRMAADLHVHPQTVRYRLARLRELLGPALDDPEARFELEVVLRARAARGAGADAP